MKAFLSNEEYMFLKSAMGLPEQIIDELSKVNLATVESLLEAIYRVSPRLLQHSFRVAMKCERVAIQLGSSPDQTATIGISSLLHDIGTIAIDKTLFLKETKWKKRKMSQFRMHTTLGREIIEPIAFLRSSIPFVERHHEYLDGSGYPNGLRGAEIPFEVRILTVVNDLDIMSEFFPWGEKYSSQECFEKITRGASTLYDPKVVEVICENRERIDARRR